MNPTLSVRAEAAAWIARLHAPDRTPQDDRSFQRWLKASEVHAQAFEQMTELWEAGSRLKSDALAGIKQRKHEGVGRFGPTSFALTAAVLIAMVGSVLWLLGGGGEATKVGEQRVLMLNDGSRITLNTSTRLEVRYDKRQRHIELIQGEALFEVAKRSNWPFVVTAAGKEITALGTAFVVRKDNERLLVTLVEGEVGVVLAGEPSAKMKVLNAGERATFAGSHPVAVDKPEIDKVMAWRQGVVALDNAPLKDAIAEMNRYSDVRIALEDMGSSEIRVSGVFRAGDSVEFARALGRTHGLKIQEEGQRIVLSGAQGS